MNFKLVWCNKEIQNMKMNKKEDVFIEWCSKISKYKGGTR